MDHGAGRFRVADGEQARLTPGAAAAAEVWSRGFLPLRPRSEGSYRLRAAFPGTAVVLAGATFEVLTETELPEDGLVVYRMRAWPEGEVVRDRVVYGAAFVRAAQAERERAAVRARARPWRFLLYPVVGLLPEEEQVRIGDRLGLYAVTATLVSGLAEGLLILLVPVLLARLGAAHAALAIVTSGGFSLLALPAFGRAFSAFFLRETGGSAPVVMVYDALRLIGLRVARHDRSVLPLTRSAFWERLSRPDTVSPSADGSFVYRGLLPHLSWTAARNLQSGGDYWRATAEPPELDRGRLVYVYRLDPVEAQEPGANVPTPPTATAYVDEVMSDVRREWDDLNEGFAWLTSFLSEDRQARAFDHRCGPEAARHSVYATAGLGALGACYVLSFLPGPPGDPVAPALGVLAVLQLADSGRRLLATRSGRYAPSLWRVLIPSDLLRPERVAYQAHRDAERSAIGGLSGGTLRRVPPRSSPLRSAE